MIYTGGLKNKFKEMEAFAREKFPPQLPVVQDNVTNIERLYSQAGCPGMPDLVAQRTQSFTEYAIDWFESLFMQWEQEHEIASAADDYHNAIQEAMQTGDVVQVSGTPVPTAKSIARHVVLSLIPIINASDEQQRGLTDTDVLSVEYTLLLSLVHLRSLGKAS